MNGLGNLVLGYNAEPPFPISRAGSHCLVLGAYSSYAGIAAGFDNHTTAPYASALGGRSNRSAGPFCSIVGGAFNNTTDGHTASIRGG